MKGNCEDVICQICNQNMSFGRIKRHIKSRHKEITLEQYLNKFYLTLPLHQPCVICKDKIVYKYQTCSKECHSKLISNKLVDLPKPKGFMNEEHKANLSKSKLEFYETHEGTFTGHKHTKETKQIQSETIKRTKPHKGFKHSLETIEKIFAKKKMNKLEKLVSEILKENNIKYYFQFPIRKNKTVKIYDFKIKGHKILLEIDGDYYHGGPGCKTYFYRIKENKQNDIVKNGLAKDSGYKLIRIWESDIKKNPNIILEKLKF